MKGLKWPHIDASAFPLAGGVLILPVERQVQGWTCAVAMGVSQLAATDFCFLLGIPTLLSAGALQILSVWHHAHKLGMPMREDWGRLMVAGVVAAITAFWVVRWLLRFVQNHTFVVFGWYRIGFVLGLLALWLLHQSTYPAR